jgi:hypothetical protein
MNRRLPVNQDLFPSASTRGTTTSPLPRWRYAFIALLLAFNIGSAGQPPSAQPSQTDDNNAKFYMVLINPKTTLCTGESHTYTVVINGQFMAEGAWSKARAINGVNIEAYADPRSLGTFYDAEKNGKGGSVYEETSESYLRPISVDFVFTAGKKPGKGALTFQGLVKGYAASVGYVSVPPLPVKVVPCKFKVRTIGEADAMIYNITVISNDAIMTADAAGSYTGSGSLYWVYSKAAVPCSTFAISAADSQVNLTGKLDDEGQQLAVTETFTPTTVSLNASCALGSYSGQQTGSLGPLTFSVASSGGVITQSLKATGISFSARVSVTPEEDTAAAFIPDTMASQAGWPFSGLTALWDSFPRLNAAALGLDR